jgi:hypothetical protein
MVDAGARVWGISSMGAIRAAEMRDYGVLGHGSVYDFFCSRFDVPDDEVAVMHSEAPEYRQLTEAMVDIRNLLRVAESQGFITVDQRDSTEESMSEMWFADRTLISLNRILVDRSGEHAARMVAELASSRERYSLKLNDLRTFLQSDALMGLPA